jgi:hypothetical protein
MSNYFLTQLREYCVSAKVSAVFESVTRYSHTERSGRMINMPASYSRGPEFISLFEDQHTFPIH